MVRKYQLGKPITTGGAGYFPEFNQETVENLGYRYITGGLPISIVRQRLYNNLYPHSYNDIIGRFRNAVVNNEKDRRIRGNKENAYLNDQRDPIFAEYLNIPEKDRHKSNYKLVESKYLPTIGKSGSKYYASPTVTAWREEGRHLGIISNLISSMYNSFDYSRRYDKPLNIGESRVGVPLSDDLGKHTISRGYDDKGEYVSYYDKWDLSPFGGSAGERDDSRGIGTPISFYDRIYLDDYYGVKTPTHSTYLPEVIVKGRKHKDGGIIEKFQLGNKVSWWSKVGNFINSDAGKALISTGTSLLKTNAENKLLEAEADALKALNEYDWEETMRLIQALNLLEANLMYLQWALAYLSGSTTDLPSLIVAQHLGWKKYSEALTSGLLNLKNKNAAIDTQTLTLKSNNWGGILTEGLGLVGNYLGNKNTQPSA